MDTEKRSWLTKDEYISKYGEDAWKRKLEAHKESSRRSAKKWYDKNKELAKEKSRKYRQEHPDKVRDSQKKYSDANKEKRNEYSKQWNATNKSYFDEYSKTEKYRANRILQNYNRYDKEDGHDGFNLTKEYILENIFKSSCIYCGDSNWKHLGCDRIDNEKAHTEDNVVCSCGICNVERFYKRMSVEEFIEYRKTHPRDEEPQKLEKVVEINGKKVIRKVL